MRIFIVVLNVLALLVLGAFAKDNLVAELKSLSAADRPTAAIKNSGDVNIEVVFSPNRGATAAIVGALAEARSSILVAAYSFTSQEIAKALLDAKKRKLNIRLILDKSQVSQKYSASTFFANNGFAMRIDEKHAIFHNKFMIIDDMTVITGSFNFTKAAETKNAENILIIRNDRSLAQLYKDNFEHHWDHAAKKLARYHDE